MTNRQRKEHKIGNQRRREMILKLGKTADPRDRAWWVKSIGAIQKGKYASV